MAVRRTRANIPRPEPRRSTTTGRYQTKMQRQGDVYSALNKETRAIENRPAGWSTGEERKAHRRANLQEARAMQQSRRR